MWAQLQPPPDEEILPVLEQFPNLKLFDKFLTESDTFLNRCLGDEKKHYHDNLLQVEMIKAREAKMVPQVAAHSATMSPHRLSGVELLFFAN